MISDEKQQQKSGDPHFHLVLFNRSWRALTSEFVCDPYEII